jgi:hypothetical protein
LERQFIQRRLAEEQNSLATVAGGTLPILMSLPQECQAAASLAEEP